MPTRKLRRPLAITAALIVLALSALAIYYGLQSNAERLTPQQTRDLVHAKNVALGHLENQQLDESLEAFDSLLAKIANDPLPARNLAVARVLAVGNPGETPAAGTLTAAQQALAEVVRREGESAEYHWLALHVALVADDREQARRHIDAIASTEGTGSWAAAAEFARFRTYHEGRADQIDPQAIAALQKACALRPENAWLRVEWCRTIGSQMLQTNEPPDDLADQLARTRTSVQPFAYVINTYAKVDVLALLDEAEQAAQDGDSLTVAARLLTVANVMAPHATADQRSVRRHPLEFVLEDFREEFYKGKEIDEVEPPPIEVKFVPLATEFGASTSVEGELLDVELADFDLDGRLDLIELHDAGVVVLSRGSEGEKWNAIASIEASGASHLIVQDLDSDFDEAAIAVRDEGTARAKQGSPALLNGCPSADVDVVAYGEGGVQLFENRFDAATGSRSLVAVADDKRPEATNISAAAVGDWEADGDLDLVLAAGNGIQLWANNNQWTFSDITSRSALPESTLQITQLLPVDFDRDVDIDILVASPDGAGWLENVRHGQFRWRPFASDFPDLKEARWLEVVDADANASWDLAGVLDQKLQLVTTQSASPGAIQARASRLIADENLAEIQVFDYDNDGRDDLLGTTATSIPIFKGQLGNTFKTVDLLRGTTANVFGFGDLDHDGDLDVAIASAGGLELLENQGGNKNHWLDVSLQAQQIKGQQHAPSGRVSPYGLGSLLELKVNRHYQARLVRGQTIHFGLGQAAEADVVRVMWLNGVPQNILRPAADLFVCEQQLLNTSCPYLYAWNGERFEFVTDLLWNAPLGLLFAEGALAPPREWEYLKIPGDALVPKDGEYVVQVTAELWEADYFDEIRLIAVDHPADVAIYSNEKVGPPDIAEYKIHTATDPRPVLSARNHNGRDVLGEISRPDGVYARAYDRKLRQGVTEESYLELDLGDVGGAEQITLFLTGWVFPSSTSINAALSQGGSLPPPKPPALLVPDGANGWKKALPFMGFPGGKTKTIAIDLSGKLAENDGRIRIATTMELFWDHIFYTVDEPPAKVSTTELPLLSADLHYRGFSRVVPDSGNGPEQFLYEEVATASKWPPMHGRFTRFGDVKALLTASDDRLLVMGAGDEATLRFAVPDAPLPTGWQRDFLLYSVGWDKDCNLMTVLGEAVEPLPFRAMRGYPWSPEEQLPDRAAYVREFQTREQTRSFWRSLNVPTRNGSKTR